MRPWIKNLLIFVVGGLGGTGLGFAAGIFAYPYIFLADVTAMEQVAGRDTKPVIARGTFIHADKNDPVHYGKGRVTVFKDLVHLEPDFEVGPGPKYHVYLSTKAMVKSTGEFDPKASLDLGMIKAFKGSQSFAVPAGTDLKRYHSVVVWCKAFGVLITPASLKR